MRNDRTTIVDAQGNSTSYLSAGEGSPVVLLHGIGGGAGSWREQLESVNAIEPVTQAPLPGGEGLYKKSDQQLRLLAWDAPGYGASSPIPGSEMGSALAYGKRFWAWLDALTISEPVDLLGQSLGCIFAAAAASLKPARVASLTLLAPAQGYGKAQPEERAKKRDARIRNVETLGMAGLAQKRAAAMLAPNASAEKVHSVQENMAAIGAAGYIAATHALADSDLKTLLKTLTMPLTIAAGRNDTITPYAQCKALAAEMKCLFVTLDDAGHASPTDAPELVSALIASRTSIQRRDAR
jgi:pimeloyl-ACP methyl ester carboxylesterase